ncbi:FAD-dependent monooxygenase [Streptomyces yatensis]|uniref:FAD-binding domain-containing protein n=1 Tax=Streptomyces yatensis TaxID=155177 RepID=A0ABN2G9T2_9ACTN|nr:FAD-dependent monooxygenase [Streptomyces yatensis]
MTVEDTATGRTSVVEAEYVVAADGAESATREQVGIARSGQGVVGGQHVNVLFRADLGELIAGRGFFHRAPVLGGRPDQPRRLARYPDAAPCGWSGTGADCRPLS